MAAVEGTELPFCYLTTVGRRTGRPHTVEIWFGAEGRTLYLLGEADGEADWVRNIRANHHVGVRLGDRRHTATARVVERGTDEDAAARRLLLAKYQKAGAHDLGNWAKTALAVAIDLADQSR